MKPTNPSRKLSIPIRHLTSKIFLLVGALSFSVSAIATTYTYTDLGTLLGSTRPSRATAINNYGQIAGFAVVNADGAQHAIMWSGMSATDLGTLGGTHSIADDINDSGQVVGLSYLAGDGEWHATVWNGTTATDLGTAGTNSQAFGINNNGQVAGANVAWHAKIWDGTNVTNLSTLGGTYSLANAINNNGQAAGWSSTSGNSNNHATLWNDTTPVDLGTLGGASSNAYALNDNGQIVGDSLTNVGGYAHAALWDNGNAIDLGTLGGKSSAALAVNNAGQIVGWASIANLGVSHAVLWENGTTIDLNSFLDATMVNDGWVLTSAYDINDNGWIVGVATRVISATPDGYSSTGEHAFLLSLAPVPEPEAYVQMLAGIGLVGWMTRQRKR